MNTKHNKQTMQSNLPNEYTCVFLENHKNKTHLRAYGRRFRQSIPKRLATESPLLLTGTFSARDAFIITGHRIGGIIVSVLALGLGYGTSWVRVPCGSNQAL